MKNKIIKVKNLKPIREKLWKLYLRIITNACVKRMVLQMSFERRPKNKYLGPDVCVQYKYMYTNICTVPVHYRHMKYAFAGFCSKIFKKKFQKTF